ncbi:MAG: GntR family transcriptional regulator [Anaerolineae bacterium]
MAMDRAAPPGGPLYRQLIALFQRQIESGELRPGDMLPSLRQLCREHQVSTITVRRALQELVAQGLLHSQQGIGTFVTGRSRRTRIALVIIGFFEQEWRRSASIFGDLVGGAAAVAWEQETLFSITRVDPGRHTAAVLASILDERFFDGLLLRMLPDVTADDLEPLLSAGLPYVVIKRHIPGLPINCIIVDDAEAARTATAHLIAHGRRRIAFACPQNAVIGRERLAGYRQALAESGIGQDESLIAPVPDWFEEQGYRALRRLMEAPSPPDALFAAGDQLAAGAYRAAAELGVRIPEDLAIVGYDDIPASASLQPPLTTVRTSYYDFGARAMRLLLDLIAGRVEPPARVVLEAPLIVRASCGAH